MVAGGIFSAHKGIPIFPAVYFSLVCFHQAQGCDAKSSLHCESMAFLLFICDPQAVNNSQIRIRQA